MTERRYGGHSAQERRAARRARLLTAGYEQFSRDGYTATTIEGLCAAASLNARYFYEQFDSREALMLAIYEREVHAAFLEVERALEETPEPSRRLAAGISAFLATMLADERGARIVYLESHRAGPELEAARTRIREDYLSMLASELSELPRYAGRAPGELRRVAVALIGAVDGLIIDGLTGGGPAGGPAIYATVLDAFGSALG